MMVGTIEKKIYFYKMNLRNESKPVKFQEVFSHINSLPFDKTGRYLELYDGNARSMFVDRISSRVAFRIGTKRINGLPSVETHGETSLLEIPPDSGLFEPVHCIVFPHNVIGFESNYYGPKPNSLKNYILNKAQDIVDEVEMIPLVRTDIYELISQIGEIKLFKLGLHRDMEKQLKKYDPDLHTLFRTLKRVTDAEYLEIIVRAKRYSRDTINIPLIGKIPNLLSKPEVRDGIDTCMVRAINKETEKVEPFDLLQQYILSTKRVTKQDEIHRSVNQIEMYHAIVEAYDELKFEIDNIIGGMD